MPYHHGNLQVALIDSAVELAAADGADAVALREVARRVGVSHNAAYRHFTDREALMRAVAARALTGFGESMRDRIAAAAQGADVESSYDRLAASGRSYVEYATEHAQLFRAICAFPMGSVQPDTDVVHPYQQLTERLDDLVTVGAITPERRGNAEIAACSAVHGFAMLTLDGPFRNVSSAEREQGLAQVLRVVRFGI
ncbi:TetR/AcrR family transcriptional regulator [uncultured Jatrophihabitans sp.]|uniref:TetR/AcrR family transcriptional regulator n=1 Tax=uncultured Jatrophihabitans sp. TaxID=1610747 RepID=UPI0035C9A04B